jgi:hypothetical protein
MQFYYGKIFNSSACSIGFSSLIAQFSNPIFYDCSSFSTSYTQADALDTDFEACLYPRFSESSIFVPIFSAYLFFHKRINHTALPGVVRRVVQAFVPTPLSCLFFVLKNSPVLHDPKTAISIQCSGVEDLTVLFKRCLHPIILVA